MNRRLIVVLGLIFTTIVIVLIATYMYFADTRSISVTVNDAKSIQLYEKNGEAFKKVGDITSGTSVRVNPKYQYQLEYQGNEGFSNGTLEFDPTQPDFAGSADFSKEKLNAVYVTEKDDIERALITAYPNISPLYSIEKGQLYKRGDWYGALLVYKGTSFFNTDDLRVVMKKEGSAWSAKWLPMPSLNVYVQKDVPLDVLQKVNNL